MKLRFKTGEFVNDEDSLDYNIVSRMQMWLIDDDYMAKTDVNDLVRDAVKEIQTLRKTVDVVADRVATESSLADVCAYGLCLLVDSYGDAIADLPEEIRVKIDIIMSAWQVARGKSPL